MLKGALQIFAGEKNLLSMDSFSLKENVINIVFGESGIGKSLAHKSLVSLLDSSVYSVKSDHVPPEQVFYVFQEPSSHLNNAMSLFQQVREGILAEAKNLEPIFNALFPNHSHNSFLAEKPTKEFPSGGEKQRILVLMGLLAYERYAASKAKSALLVFDEATAHLDNTARNLVLDELLRLHKKKPATVSFITHDYSLVAHLKGKRNLHYTEFIRQDGGVVQRDCKHSDILKNIASLSEVDQKPQNEIALKTGQTFSMYGKTFGLYRKTKPSEFILRRGEIVYVKSPSGGGKTTFLNVLLGTRRAADFPVFFPKILAKKAATWRDYSKQIWGKELVMVYQNADEVLQENATVFENFQIVANGLSRGEAATALQQLFSDDSLLDKKIHSLSGGQKQRVNILRSLLLKTPIILFDEPLKGMDYRSIQKFIDLLRELVRGGTSVVMVSHMEDVFDRLIPKESHYEITSAKPASASPKK